MSRIKYNNNRRQLQQIPYTSNRKTKYKHMRTTTRTIISTPHLGWVQIGTHMVLKNSGLSQKTITMYFCNIGNVIALPFVSVITLTTPTLPEINKGDRKIDSDGGAIFK